MLREAVRALARVLREVSSPGPQDRGCLRAGAGQPAESVLSILDQEEHTQPLSLTPCHSRLQRGRPCPSLLLYSQDEL